MATELQQLSEPSLRERYDPPRMRSRSVYPGRYWVLPDSAEDVFQDLMSYFRKFRDFATEAANEGMGLLVCPYEDW